MAQIFSERQILTEILTLYKEKPCLWNPEHEHYSIRSAREQAFVELRDKYQLICENATIETVKKKIDYMRCAYRRERNKVLAAREQGEVYRPVLWYFDYLTFLNDEDDLSYSKHETIASLQENEDASYEFEEVPKKRSKLEEILLSAPMSPSPPQVRFNSRDPMKEEPEDSVAELESEAFGKTLGLQLRELNSTQRYIAEKLISDVIFYARLGQLATNTSIVTE